MTNKTTIAVTGGAGYIGSHTVVQLMEAGYEVVIIDNLSRTDETLLKGIKQITKKEVPFYQTDCRNTVELDKIFTTHKIDAVIHFAAFKAVGESVEKPLDYYENNVFSLTALLRTMQKHQVEKIIFSSSCTVYGEPDSVPVTESSPIKPANSPYGATKQMCERILEDSYQLGFKVMSLRYFNPIGAHPSVALGELPIGAPNNLVPYITQTAAGVRQQLTIFGNDYQTKDGTCIRDYIHVVDLAEAHVKALVYLENINTSVCCEAVNVGTGQGSSVMELVEAFQRVNAMKLAYKIGARRPGDVEKVYADPKKAFEVLNWKAQYSLEDALKHAWAWEKNIRKV